MFHPINPLPNLNAFIKRWALFISLTTGLCGTAFSQSAGTLEEVPTTASEGTPDENADPEAASAAEPGPVDTEPSRYAGANIKEYTRSRLAAFSMKDRETDPFGLYQDLEAHRAVKQQMVAEQPSKRAAATPPTPLAEIIKLIPITTIMPSDKAFLVGIRSFSEGEELSLFFQGKLLKMKILSVSSRKITFRNLESSEDATLEIDMLPPGMVSGSDKIRPAGMASPADNLPLNLGAPLN